MIRFVTTRIEIPAGDPHYAKIDDCWDGWEGLHVLADLKRERVNEDDCLAFTLHAKADVFFEALMRRCTETADYVDQRGDGRRLVWKPVWTAWQDVSGHPRVSPGPSTLVAQDITSETIFALDRTFIRSFISSQHALEVLEWTLCSPNSPSRLSVTCESTS